jgi:hypothetical protein
MAIRMIVGFGPILLFGLIGFLYVWFSTSPRRKTDTKTPEAPQPSNRR